MDIQKGKINTQEGEKINLLFSWKENKKDNKSFFWLVSFLIIIIALAGYLFWQKNFLGCVSLIIAAFIVILLQSDKGEVECKIFSEGIKIKNEFYRWGNIKGFGVIPELEELIVFTKGKLVQRLTVPIKKEDIEKIKNILKKYIPEKKVEITLLDVFRKKIGID